MRKSTNWTYNDMVRNKKRKTNEERDAEEQLKLIMYFGTTRHSVL